MDIEKTVNAMTDVEKTYLVQGTNANYTNEIPRLGNYIPTGKTSAKSQSSSYAQFDYFNQKFAQ